MADQQALQNSITNLNNQVNALTTALQQFIASQATNTTTTYAATPGTSKVDDLIDYSTRYGAGLYEDGSKALYESEGDKFDLDNAKVTSFVRDVQDRAHNMGWDGQNQGITNFTVNGSNIDIIEDYGRIDIADIQTQSEPFYLSTGAKFHQRASQNNEMMAKMLKESLTKSAKDQVAVYKNEYELTDGATPPKKVILAPALYKVIMRLTTLDNKSTNKALRDKIKSLPSYALTVNGDIDLIHTRFNDTYAQLKARGEEVNDKEGILFDTYSHVPDAKFRKYMDDKKDAYYDNVNDMANTTWVDVMKKAKSKFDFLKQDPEHTWGAPSSEEEQVIALKAEIIKVKDKNLQLSKSLQSKLDKLTEPNANANAADASATNAQGAGGGSEKKKKTKNKKNNSNKRQQNEDEAWKKVPPKAGESKQMKKNNKTWNWCVHHMAWCIHKEEDCTKGKELAATRVAHQATVDKESTVSPAYASLLAYLASNSEG